MRDDFPEEVKRTLAARVNYFCSNPDCRAQTSGPQNDPSKVVNVGVAAHTTAASPGGPRYNPALSPEARRHSDNGIWLCQNCAKLVDSDVGRFDETLLRAWKTIAEDRARNSLGKSAPDRTVKDWPGPKLKLVLELRGIERDTYAPLTPVRSFVLGLKNGVGCGTAKFPGIRYARACGLTVDLFGIDGCYGFGLPRSPSENEWETFRGGVDHVIHAGETLGIAKLIQRGKRKETGGPPPPNWLRPNDQRSSEWVFDAVTFQCEITVQGVSSRTVEETVPGDQLSWPY